MNINYKVRLLDTPDPNKWSGIETVYDDRGRMVKHTPLSYTSLTKVMTNIVHRLRKGHLKGAVEFDIMVNVKEKGD